MGEYTVEVVLSAPAKVGGRYRKAGDTVTVSDTIFGQLLAAGSIDETATAVEVTSTNVQSGGDFDKALAAAVADREANWSTALDHFETMAADQWAAATVALEERHAADLQALEAKLAESETSLSEASQRIETLEAELAAAKAAAEPEKPSTGAGSKTRQKS